MFNKISVRKFTEHNRARSASIQTNPPWGTKQFAVALLGEVGEMCDMIKKYNRLGGEITEHGYDRKALGAEIADTLIYMDVFYETVGGKFDQIMPRWHGGDIPKHSDPTDLALYTSNCIHKAVMATMSTTELTHDHVTYELKSAIKFMKALCAMFGLDLYDCTIEKFNAWSTKHGYPLL